MRPACGKEAAMAKTIKKKNATVRYYTKPKDYLYMALVHILCAVSVICIMIPLIYVVAASFSSPKALLSGQVFLLPVDFTLRGYKMLLHHELLVTGFCNSLLYTVVGTVINLVMTVLAAYPLSRKDLAIRNPIMLLFTFTMLFNGGMIPTYILIKNLGMLDSIWALVVPTSISVWNLIITRTYFQSTIPGEVQESASVDGCDDFTFLIKIAIPLAKPILAVNVLLYAVGHWNSYFNEMMYLSTNTKFPLQLVLREILVNMGTAGMTLDVTKQLEMQETKYLLQYSSIIVGSVPVMLLYPFVQKYFVKGIMVGAIKG